jgi:NAD(P)-dependent dehydrogenase (short-subunit alcohol dehydrogenase family)
MAAAVNEAGRTTDHKTIMVTGASSGIGRATAGLLASGGHHVFAVARREHELSALAREHPGVTPLVVDVADVSAVNAAYKDVDRATAGQGLDVLVNAAGNIALGPVEAIPDAEARRQFEVNLFGLLTVTRAVLPAMRARRRGRIVNISSIMGRFVLPGWGLYSASKFAVEACSDALRMELGRFGIVVVVVEPGMTDTALYAESTADCSRTEAFGAYRPKWKAGFVPERLTTGAVPPETVARAVTSAALDAHPRARYVVGWRNSLNARVVPALPTSAADRARRRIVGLE